MKLKDRISLFLAIFSFSLFFPFPVFGQNTSLSPTPTTATSLGSTEGINSVCLSPVEDYGEYIPKGTQTVPMSASGLIPGTPAYVALCLSKNGQSSEYRCTSSNAEIDKKIFGADNTDLTLSKCRVKNHHCTGTYITKKVDFSVKEGNPFTPNGESQTVTVILRSVIAHFAYPSFYVFQTVPANLGAGGGGVAEGEAASLQQGTTTFDQLFSENNEKKCAVIRWDPFGRVFDAQSLEPIPGVEVRVLDKINPDSIVQIPDNYQVTDSDGVYSFFVEPGTYYLKLANIPFGMQFISNPSLNPNYVHIYSKEDGTSSIYIPDSPIPELIDTPEEEVAGRPFIEQRDIPLSSKNNQPLHFSVKRIENSESMIVLGRGNLGATKYEGRVSHPFTFLSLVGVDSKKVVAKTKADKNGFWKLFIRNELIPADEGLDLKLTKADLTKSNFPPVSRNFFVKVRKTIFRFFKVPVLANKKKIFQPILRYVEGFATSSKGKYIPNADVYVQLAMNNSLYYKTKADETGYFKIYSGNLPVFNYYLKFVNPLDGSVTMKTTTSFVKNNKKYLANKKLNLMSFVNNDEDLNKTASSPSQFAVTDKRNLIRQNDEKKGNGYKEEVQKSSRRVSGEILMMVVILLFLVGGVGVGVFLYIKKKKGPPLDESTI